MGGKNMTMSETQAGKRIGNCPKRGQALASATASAPLLPAIGRLVLSQHLAPISIVAGYEFLLFPHPGFLCVLSCRSLRPLRQRF
jgi:hypothetical protein